MHSNEEENEKLDIKIIILDIVGIILFLCAHFIPNLNNTVKIILYIISYGIIGIEIFGKAVKHLFKNDMFDENLENYTNYLYKRYSEENKEIKQEDKK